MSINHNIVVWPYSSIIIILIGLIAADVVQISHSLLQLPCLSAYSSQHHHDHTNINIASGPSNCQLLTLHILSVVACSFVQRNSAWLVQCCTIPNQIELKYSLMIKDCKEMFPSRSRVTSRLVSCICPASLITVIHHNVFAEI